MSGLEEQEEPRYSLTLEDRIMGAFMIIVLVVGFANLGFLIIMVLLIIIDYRISFDIFLWFETGLLIFAFGLELYVCFDHQRKAKQRGIFGRLKDFAKEMWKYTVGSR